MARGKALGKSATGREARREDERGLLGAGEDLFCAENEKEPGHWCGAGAGGLGEEG